MGTRKFNDLLIQVTSHMTDAIGFVSTYMKDKKGQGYAKASASNYLQILAGEMLWNDYLFSQRDVINGYALTQNCKSYELLLKEAYAIKAKAEAFLECFRCGKDTNSRYAVSAKNYDKIIQAVGVWNKLSSEERKAIHAMLVCHHGESYPMSYERAMHVKKEVDAFVSTYAMGRDGKRFTKVDDENYQTILSGQSTWEEKSALIQEAIDQVLKQPTFLQLLNGAMMVLDSTNDFIHTFLTDKNGVLFSSIDKENYRQILQGKAVWKRMTLSQRTIIDQVLRSQERKIYEDMTDDARVLCYEIQRSVE